MARRPLPIPAPAPAQAEEAAQPPQPPARPPVTTLRVTSALDGEQMIVCGSFLYDRDPGEHGPYILTFFVLPGTTAQEGNLPFRMMSRVIAWEVILPGAEAGQ